MKQNRLLLILNFAVLLGLATAWICYALFGHRLLGAMYRGESIAFLNLIITGQAVYPLAYYFHAADRLMGLGSLVALGITAGLSVLLKSLPSLAPFLARYAIPVLASIPCLFALSTSAIVFCYPLEIETRESTVWLHVMALKAGVNIYDHSQVAFINMPHGPLDSLFKLLVTTALPMLQPWHVTRFAVLLLPCVFLAIAWRLLRKSSLKSPFHVLYLGGLGFMALLVSAKEFLFVGRSDATAAVFLLLLTYASIFVTPKSRSTALLHGMACGALAIATVLTNWRVGPAVVAVFVYTIFRYQTATQVTPRQTWTYLASYGIAAVALAGILLIFLFDANPVLYYRQFFGFFSNASGWGHGEYPDSLFRFAVSLFNPLSDRKDPRGGPLLLALAVYGLMWGTRVEDRKPWRLLSGFVFLSCAVAYYLNYDGGGPWYFIPFLIIMWFELGVRYAALTPLRRASLGVCLVTLIGVNARSVVMPTVHRVKTWQRATAFAALLRSTASTNTMLSEDTFFFERSYHGELIDMGDTISQVTQTGYYGEDFDRTARRHFERTAKYPPDYVVTGFTESPELKQLITEKYVLVAEGPGNLTANGDGVSSQLFQRRDLAGSGKSQGDAALRPPVTAATLDGIRKTVLPESHAALR
jgi:hypothetical protein